MGELSLGNDAAKLTQALASRRADKPNPLDISSRLPALGFGAIGLNAVAVIAFLALAASLYYFARKPLDGSGQAGKV